MGWDEFNKELFKKSTWTFRKMESVSPSANVFGPFTLNLRGGSFYVAPEANPKEPWMFNFISGGGGLGVSKGLKIELNAVSKIMGKLGKSACEKIAGRFGSAVTAGLFPSTNLPIIVGPGAKGPLKPDDFKGGLYISGPSAALGLQGEFNVVFMGMTIDWSKVVAAFTGLATFNATAMTLATMEILVTAKAVGLIGQLGIGTPSVSISGTLGSTT